MKGQSDDFVRLLVCAIVVPAKSEKPIDGSTGVDSVVETCDTIQSHRFVLPVQRAATIHDLCQKVEGRMAIKLQAKAVQCEGVYVADQAQASYRTEEESASLERLNQWFEKQYSVEKEQTVS